MDKPGRQIRCNYKKKIEVLHNICNVGIKLYDRFISVYKLQWMGSSNVNSTTLQNVYYILCTL